MKKGMLILVLCFSFLTLPFSLAYSRTFYVSWSSGNDSWEGTSPSTAWKSLDKATEGPTGYYQPGDVIKFKKGDVWDLTNPLNQEDVGAGVAGLRIYRDGTPGNEISFISDDSFTAGSGAGKPVFDGKRLVHMGIYSTRSYIKIDGLEIRNLPNSGWYCNGILIDHPNSTNWVIKNVVIHDSFNGIFIKGKNHLIEKNVIYDIPHSGIFSDQDMETYNIVRENTVYNCDYNGIDIVGNSSGVGAGNRYWTICRNYVFNSRNGIELSSADDSDVFSNISAHNGIGSEWEVGGIMLANGCDNNRVYNNTCFANRFGIAIHGGAGSGNVIKNNIMAENQEAEVSTYSGKATWLNNLYFNSSDTRFIFWEGDNPVFKYPSWWTANYDSQALYSNPNFKNTSNLPLGLTLVSPSDAIDAGIDLGSKYQMDYKGVLREAGKWDLGALESTSGDDNPPEPPIGVRIL